MIIGNDISYTTGGHRILAGFSLEAHSGQRTAIVGPSGAGKTTALSVLILDQFRALTESGVGILTATHDSRVMDAADRLVEIAKPQEGRTPTKARVST